MTPFFLARDSVDPSPASFTAQDIFADLDAFTRAYLKDRIRLSNEWQGDPAWIVSSPTVLANVLHAADLLLPPGKVATWTLSVEMPNFVLRAEAEVFARMPPWKFRNLRLMASAAGYSVQVVRSKTVGCLCLSIPADSQPNGLYTRRPQALYKALRSSYER